MIRSAFLVFFVFLLVSCNAQPFDYDLYESQPIVKVDVTIAAKTERELQSRLETFAQRAGYKLRVSRSQPTEPQFLIMMWRNDSMIIATNSFGPYQFGIYSSKKHGISPGAANQLKVLLANIGGA